MTTCEAALGWNGMRITLSTAVLLNLESSREGHKEVDDAADKGGRNGHQGTPPERRRKKAANAALGERVSGICKSKGGSASGLHAKVVGPELNQDS